MQSAAAGAAADFERVACRLKLQRAGNLLEFLGAHPARQAEVGALSLAPNLGIHVALGIAVGRVVEVDFVGHEIRDVSRASSRSLGQFPMKKRAQRGERWDAGILESTRGKLPVAA